MLKIIFKLLSHSVRRNKRVRIMIIFFPVQESMKDWAMQDLLPICPFLCVPIHIAIKSDIVATTLKHQYMGSFIGF